MNNIDKDLLAKTNGAKKNERRYIAGILQTILGVISILASSGVYLDAEKDPRLVGTMVTLISLAIFILYDGIHMIKTSRDWPTKSTEITNHVLGALLILNYFFGGYDFDEIPVFIAFALASIVFHILGSSIKNENLKARIEAKKQWLDANK